MLLYFGPISETHELGEGVEHVRRFRHAVQHQVAHKAQADDLEYESALGDHEHGQLLLLELGAQSLSLLAICVFADHGDLGIFSLEEVLQPDIIEVTRHKYHGIACLVSGNIVNSLPQALGEEGEPCLVTVSDAFDFGHALEGHLEAELFRECPGTARL